MMKLYIKIAFRYLLKNTLYSFINIAGLAIGIASFLLIMGYVNFEKSYDKFEGSENVYRVFMDYKEGDQFVVGDAMSYNLSAPTLAEAFPEILDYTRIYRIEKSAFDYRNNVLESESGGISDHSYFDIFQTNLIKGDQSTALKKPNSIVLTETLAKKIFADRNPIGELISTYYEREEAQLTVTGVIPDHRENTHLKLNYLISFETHKNWAALGQQQKLNWSGNDWYTYIKVTQGTNFAALQEKITAFKFVQGEERHNIQKLEDIHLYSNKPYEAETNGSITRVKLLSTIGFIILILSWLNYINLSVTKSLERAKEIGIRKVVGAVKPQLVFQFLMESVLLNFVALGFAGLLCFFLLPHYTSLTGVNILLDASILIDLAPHLGIVILGMLLASLYPAFILSGYKPLKALKGKIRTSSKEINIRKGLIITQFIATIVLLSGALLVSRQIKFLKEQPIGANLNQVLAIQGEVLEKNADSLTIQRFKSLENELERLPFVDATATAETYPGDGYAMLSSFVGMGLPDGRKDDQSLYYQYQVDPNYFSLMEIEFFAGKAFLPNSANGKRDIVVNQKFLDQIGITDISKAINTTLDFFKRKWTIVGVMKDYHHFGVKEASIPLLIRPGNSNNNLLVKLNNAAISNAGLKPILSNIQNTWTTVFPKSTFNYTFLDHKFEQQYLSDEKFSEAFNIFTLLAIFIAALGLFGLTSYICIQRRKEIGIRKVSGASIATILKLLNIDFLKWIGMAFLIAVPLAWYGMSNWLETFAMRTEISWWIFIISAALTLLITTLSVSWQSYGAASRNPIDALREE